LKCHLYYPADLDRCPTCHASQRVSPVTANRKPKLAQKSAEKVPGNHGLEQEREEFLRQFKAQLKELHPEIAHAPEAAVCKLKERHAGEAPSAEICGGCHERLQERVDVLEAALHIDPKEAAQIVYDAVWADPSQPGQTYQNAANALLNELRQRAGVAAIMGPLQPLKH
jgi:cytochrome c553